MFEKISTAPAVTTGVLALLCCVRLFSDAGLIMLHNSMRIFN